MLPHILLAGPPRRQGQLHGQAAAERIRHNLAVYFDRFQREGRLDRAAVLDRAAAYWPVIQAADPGYAAALEGLAEGVGEPLMDLVALNVRYEILYHQYTARAMVDGCSAFALLPERTAGGHLLMGQNWDWIPEVQGVVLETRGEPVDCLAFTEAGIVGGKIGLNTAGLGLAVNGLLSTQDDWSRLGTPFHVRCHQILRATELAAAAAIARAAPRPCSANFLIGQAPDRVVDVETAPEASCSLAPVAGLRLHTNHFVDPAALGVVEPREESVPRSRRRYRQLEALLDEGPPLDVPTLQARLQDHVGAPSWSVCRHPDPARAPEERYETRTSAVMDLAERRLWLTDGPPCRSPAQAFRLGEAASAG
jgi:isopenicillin-N N-acyltransferase-like protein